MTAFDDTVRMGIGATTGGSIGAQPWNLYTTAAGDGTGTANATLANPAFSLTGVPVTGNGACLFGLIGVARRH